MSDNQLVCIHNLIKKIFKNKKNLQCDNYLSCYKCNTFDSIHNFNYCNNQIIFFCNNCNSKIKLQKVIEYYKSDLFHFCKMMHEIDENIINENYNRKNIYDHFMHIFQNCINIDYMLFCNQYYIDILIIFNKHTLLFENNVAIL